MNMVITNLIDRDGELYIYEYIPWDDENCGRGEFAMKPNGECAGYFFLAKDDNTKTYYRHAVIAIMNLYKKTGKMPPRAAWVWM